MLSPCPHLKIQTKNKLPHHDGITTTNNNKKNLQGFNKRSWPEKQNVLLFATPTLLLPKVEKN